MKLLFDFHLRRKYVPKVNQMGVNCLYNLNSRLMISYCKHQPMLESYSFFTKMVDELVDFSQYDPELADGIKWLDEQARKRGISFYDMVFEVLYKHDVNKKARDWLHSKN